MRTKSRDWWENRRTIGKCIAIRNEKSSRMMEKKWDKKNDFVNKDRGSKNKNKQDKRGKI